MITIMFPFELTLIWAITAFTVYIGIFWMTIALNQRKNLNKYPKPKRYPTISVIIPAYNEESTVRKCIKSVLNISYPSKVEVIVINDGSTDRTREIAEEFQNKGLIKLINQKNKGKGAALNRGLAVAKGELVAMMDADSIVERSVAKKLVGHFEEESVAAVIPSIKAIEANNLIEKLQNAEYIISSIYRRLGSLTDTMYVTPGVFSIFKKNILRKIGGIDEKNLTEDLEIALRLRAFGYKIRNSMCAITKTKFPSTVKALYNQRMRWYRGLIKNTLHYRNMLFNKKYGYLGILQLPMNIIFPFISLIVVFLFMYTNYTGISKLITELSILGLRFPTELSLEKIILNFDWRGYVPWIISFAFGIYALVFTYAKMKEKISKTIGRLNAIIFLLIYFTIINLLLTLALIKEFTKGEEKW